VVKSVIAPEENPPPPTPPNTKMLGGPAPLSYSKAVKPPPPNTGPGQKKLASSVVVAGGAAVIVVPPDAGAKSGPPPLSAEKKAQIDDLEPQIDQLESRAASVNGSLEAMQETMKKGGLTMRGDIVSRQLSMKINLQKTKEAFALQDVDRATRYSRLTSSDLAQLETFLGR
jgi:hypothetical protein